MLLVTLTLTRHGRPPSRRRTRPEPPFGRFGRIATIVVCALAIAGVAMAPAPALGQETKGVTTAAEGAAARSGSGTASDPVAPQERQPIPEGSGGPAAFSEGAGGAVVRLFIGLGVVVGLVIGVWLLLRRLQRSRQPGGHGGQGEIDVISTTSLGPNRALHLVRVGGQRFLVGVTEQSVSPLTRVDDDVDPDAFLSQAADIGGIELSSLSFDDARDRASATATRPGSVGPSWSASGESLLDRLRARTARRSR